MQCENLAWLPNANGLLVTGSEETSPILQIWHISYPNGERRRVTNNAMNHFAEPQLRRNQYHQRHVMGAHFDLGLAGYGSI